MTATPGQAPPRRTRLALVAAIAAAVLLLDLWSKAWAWDVLHDQSIVVVEGAFHLEFGFNTGSAFGLLRDAQWARMFFVVVTLLALGYMARLTWILPTRPSSSFVAVGLIAGGALGNLHDRLFRAMEVMGEVRHGVVDFLVVFYWPGHRWPAFNVADAALVVGVGLFMLYLHRHGEPTRHDGASPDEYEQTVEYGR